MSTTILPAVVPCWIRYQSPGKTWFARVHAWEYDNESETAWPWVANTTGKGYGDSLRAATDDNSDLKPEVVYSLPEGAVER